MTQAPPPCSVIITCYNLEHYVGAAIRSVLDQCRAGEVEVIVVDDCSTDASAAVVRGFPTVRYLRTPINSGVLLAMLQGIEAAAHDVVHLLDGDDLWEPDKLHLTGAALAADPGLGLLTHDLTFIDADGTPIVRDSRPHAVLGRAPPDARGEAVREGILSLGDYVWLGSALSLRRSVVDLDGFAAWMRARPDPRNVYQDWPLAYWAAARAAVRLGYLDTPLFRYRLHGANHSGDARSTEKAVRNFRRTLNTSEAMLAIARERGVAPRHRRVVARQRRFYRYLLDLYADHRLAAAAGFVRSLPYLAGRPALLAKEATRFALIELMGAAGFTRWRAG